MRFKTHLFAAAFAVLTVAAPAAAQEVVIENYTTEEIGQQDDIPFVTSEAVQKFFGKRTMLVTYKSTLADQFENAINGRAYDMIMLKNGYSIYTACGQFSCQNKAIAVMDPKGAIVAAGMIGYQCPGAGGECKSTPSAYGFIRKGMEKSFPRKLLTDWAKQYLEVPANQRRITITAI